MDYEEFLRAVQATGAPGDRDRAERASSATLSTLGERVTRGQADNLAAALPAELQAPLLQQLGAEAEPFGAQEFVRRVAARERTSASEARAHARSVLATLRQRVDEMADVSSQLSSDYGPLLR